MAPAAASHTLRVAVLGWGNPGRGDDALGPEIVERLDAERLDHPDWPDLHLVSAHQLQLEHVLDLQGRDLAVFVDAASGLHEPFLWRLVREQSWQWSTHEVEAGQLLYVYGRAKGSQPPPSFELQVRGEDFGLDHPLSAAARDGLVAAMSFLEDALSHSGQEHWLALCRQGPDARP